MKKATKRRKIAESILIAIKHQYEIAKFNVMWILIYEISVPKKKQLLSLNFSFVLFIIRNFYTHWGIPNDNLKFNYSFFPFHDIWNIL